MNSTKYIVIKSEYGIECPVVFSSILSHLQVAGKNNVVSAGFCDINLAAVNGAWSANTQVCVWGESVSLGGIVSREEDAELIREHILLDKLGE